MGLNLFYLQQNFQGSWFLIFWGVFEIKTSWIQIFKGIKNSHTFPRHLENFLMFLVLCTIYKTIGLGIMSRNSNTRMSHANPTKRMTNQQVAAHSANKQKMAPAPPTVPRPGPSRSPSPSPSPNHNNNHTNKVTWPTGSIPRRVKKLSWDDESDSPHRNNKVYPLTEKCCSSDVAGLQTTGLQDVAELKSVKITKLLDANYCCKI